MIVFLSKLQDTDPHFVLQTFLNILTLNRKTITYYNIVRPNSKFCVFGP